MVIVAASANGKVCIEAAVQILREGGTAVDAVEAGVRLRVFACGCSPGRIQPE
jgi:gamma-glutamyltranspeptidase